MLPMGPLVYVLGVDETVEMSYKEQLEGRKVHDSPRPTAFHIWAY